MSNPVTPPAPKKRGNTAAAKRFLERQERDDNNNNNNQRLVPDEGSATSRRGYEGHDPHLPVGVHIEDSGYGDRLTIHKVETSKDLIEQPELASLELKLIPSRGHSVIINGASGSGKSTLLANYATNPNFFGPSKERPRGWFDKIFLFSPTADGDDVQRSLNIPKQNVCTDMDEAPDWIETIFRSQKQKLAGGGKAHIAPQYWFIFDDVIGETQLLTNRQFLKCWYMIRHNNGTTTACTQHYKRLPKVCRQQASFIHFFAGNQAEVQQIVDDFAPPLYSKREFADIVTMATLNPYDFLTVCIKVPWPYRFRFNLGKIIVLDRLLQHTRDQKKMKMTEQLPGGAKNEQENPEEDKKKESDFFSVTESNKTTTAGKRKPDNPSPQKGGFAARKHKFDEVRQAIETIIGHLNTNNQDTLPSNRYTPWRTK